jgi:RimJ/RimL family protein N-acetyltransferase
MLLNAETVLIGKHCCLVPYRHEHVLQYHAWMQDSALLEATGSEPLSLEEEYEMQQTWLSDETKCTYIVLDASQIIGDRDADFVQRNVQAMVGDVNLFFSDFDDHDDDDDHDGNNLTSSALFRQAEIDIMIAEPDARRKGIGREACCLMMWYAATHIPNICRFFCKINQDNSSSLALFQTKLGFRQCDYAECFRQVELELKTESPEALIEQLRQLLPYDTLQSFQCPKANASNRIYQNHWDRM